MTTLYTGDQGENRGLDWTITTEATSELLTVDEVEDRMDLSDNDDPQIIDNQIKAVRAYCERILGISLVTSQTITAYWQQFAKRLPLPLGPITSVTSVSIVNLSDGTETALTSGTDFWVEGVKNKKIRFASLYAAGIYGVKVVYVAGLSNEADKKLVKDAIMSEVVEWYHQRSNPDETQYTLGKIALSKLNVLRKL